MLTVCIQRGKNGRKNKEESRITAGLLFLVNVLSQDLLQLVLTVEAN